MDACTDQDKNVYNALLLLFEEWSSRRDKPPIVWVYEESSNLFNAEEGRKKELLHSLVYLVSCIVVYDVRYDDFPSPHPHPHPSLMMNN